MQQNFREEWAVVVGRETFILDENQIKILKTASTGGNRGILWFDKYAISIPHIQAIYLVRKTPKNVLTAGETKEVYSEEDRKKARVKLDKIRSKFGNKLKLKQT
jgi:hypothetical protein